jgi:hypothetical protein
MESVPVYKDREVIGTIELTNIRYPFEYNIGEADMVLRTAYTETRLSKVKAVFEKNTGNGNDGKVNLVSIVSKNFAVIPNQLIMQMVADVSKDLNLSTLSVKYTKNGYAMRIDLLSERKEAVEVDDTVWCLNKELNRRYYCIRCRWLHL